MSTSHVFFIILNQINNVYEITVLVKWKHVTGIIQKGPLLQITCSSYAYLLHYNKMIGNNWDYTSADIERKHSTIKEIKLSHITCS